ncbi:MAG: peptide-binding protein [Halanaerobiales bacterium]|nr:peptide-binding protein [Halanaerobiales bacterium]
MKNTVLGLVLLICLLASGIVYGEEVANTLRIAATNNIVTLNPILVNDGRSSTIISLLFNGLVTLDESLNWVPDLAENWEISSDGKEITFNLKHDVKFHDGHEFDAFDVEFTIKKIIDPEVNSSRHSNFKILEKMEIIDSHTIKFFLKEPKATFISYLSVGMLPKHILEDVEDLNTTEFNRSPIGTGPYKYGEWKKGNFFRAMAFDGYFKGRPKIDKIEQIVVPDSNTLTMKFFADELDMVAVPEMEYKLYLEKAEESNFVLYTYDKLQYTYIGLNLKKDIFRDQNVREALTYALDREMMVEICLNGLGTVAGSHGHPESWAFNSSIQPRDYDPDKARTLLTEAGWIDRNGDGIREKGDLELSFIINGSSGNQSLNTAAQIFQQNLAEVGVKVKIELMEFSVLLKEKIFPRKFDSVIMGWGLNVEPNLHYYWHSSGIDKGFNIVSYNNPEMDKLLELGQNELDQDVRKDIYWQATKILHNEQPYIWLWYPKISIVIQNRLKGTKFQIGLSQFWNIHEWYFE